MLIALGSYYRPSGSDPDPIWTPADLFAQGQRGVWYEPKPEYLFQDAGGTVPVVAGGDPVGLMLDISGNTGHAIQTLSADRPIFDGVLRFDGVNDSLLPAGYPVGSTEPFFLSILVDNVGDSREPVFSQGAASPGALVIYANDAFSNDGLRVFFGGASDKAVLGPDIKGQGPCVITITAGEEFTVRVNGVQVGRAAITTYDYSVRHAVIGGLTYTGSRYAEFGMGGLISRTGAWSLGDVQSSEGYLAKLAGITL